MRITVHGTGYVGLVTGACIAQAGNHVICVDIDEAKVAALNAGEIPIYEPGLADIVRRNRSAGRLSFTTDVAAGVRHGELQFIAVGTPKNEDGSADLRHVLTVAETIGRHMTEYKVVVDKSTVPVGTGDRVREAIAAVLAGRKAQLDFDVVSNPEFLKEGAAVADFMKPDRIIVGTDSPRAADLLRQLYEPFSRSHDKLIVMDVRSAELTKYAANVMLATKISLMNELANIAERYGADIEQVRVGIGSDPRIGYSFIYPGCGYGGSCFPKDVHALIRSAEEIGYEAQLVQAVDDVNNRQKHALFRKISAHFGGQLKGRTFALWGLAFKPNTDDIRDAKSLVIIEELLKEGATVVAYDPVAEKHVREIYPDITYVTNAREVAEGCDCLVLVTEWNEFRQADLKELASVMKRALLFDGRRVYSRAHAEEAGFEYHVIGS